MYIDSKKLTPQDIKELNAKTIDENTTILKDFNFLIEYIQNNTLEATKKEKHFARKHLAPINEILTNPIDVLSKAPVQKSYANITGLYLLLSTLGIIRFVQNRQKYHFTINERVLQS